MTTNRPLRVFLCHSSNDKPAVRELYQNLRAEIWIQPWLDEEELYPGQDWNFEIEKAVEAADVILVCLSKGSTTKEGYVQREIRIALDYADYKPEGTLYVIPIRLDECEPPRRLRAWQYADYFAGQRERGLQRLLVSLKRRADGLGLIGPATQEIRTTETKARAEEKTEFDVVIKETGTRKIDVIKVIRELTNLSLRDAKTLSETIDGKILTNVSRDIANEARKKLEKAGATVVLE